MLLHADLVTGGSAGEGGILETRPVSVEVRRLRGARTRTAERRDAGPLRRRPQPGRWIEEPARDPALAVGALQFDAGLFLRRAVLLDVVV